MRFLTPILFFAAGAWVWWTNSQSDDRVVTLPFMDMLSDDPHQQGTYTAMICVGLGAWFLLWDLVAMMRRRGDGTDP